MIQALPVIVGLLVLVQFNAFTILTGIASLVIVALVAMMVTKTVRIVPQARARNIERFGRYRKTLEPGMNFIIPFVDRVKPLIDLREHEPAKAGHCRPAPRYQRQPEQQVEHRDAEQQLGEAHQQVVDPAAVEPREQPEPGQRMRAAH